MSRTLNWLTTFSVCYIFVSSAAYFAAADVIGWDAFEQRPLVHAASLATLLRDLGAPLAALTVALNYRRIFNITPKNPQSFILYYAYLFPSIPLAHAIAVGNFLSITYGMLFIVYFWLFIIFSSIHQKFKRISAIIITSCLTACLCYSYLFLEPQFERYIGSMHPNIAGGIAACIAIFSLWLHPIARWFYLFLAFAVCTYVSSRFALVSVAAIMVMVLLWRTTWVRAALILIGASAAIAIEGLSGGRTLNYFLHFSDPNRGFGAGISGRSDAWANFLPQLEFLGGAGFRSRDAYIGAHSGILNLYLELGVVFGTLFILIALIGLLRLYRIHRFHADKSQIWLILGSFVTWLSVALFQPSAISFGDPQGFLFFVTFANALYLRGIPQRTDQSDRRETRSHLAPSHEARRIRA